MKLVSRYFSMLIGIPHAELAEVLVPHLDSRMNCKQQFRQQTTRSVLDSKKILKSKPLLEMARLSDYN